MASWGVVDGVRGVVWVTWHMHGVVGGGGQCLQRHLGDMACRWRCGGWWTAFTTWFG